MVKIEKDFWLFPLIGGFLVIISLLFPAATETNNPNNQIWLFGMVDKNSMSFFENYYLLIGSLICSLVIIIFAISMITTSIKYKLRKIYMEKVHIAWILQGFIVIFSLIVWMIMLHLLIMKANFSLIKEGDEFKAVLDFSRFWEYNTPGFAIIGTITGGVFSITGAILKKKFDKNG